MTTSKFHDVPWVIVRALVAIALIIADAGVTAWIYERWMWDIRDSFANGPYAVDRANQDFMHGRSEGPWRPYHHAVPDVIMGCTYLWFTTLPTISIITLVNPHGRRCFFPWFAAMLWGFIVALTTLVYEFVFYVADHNTAWQKGLVATSIVVAMWVLFVMVGLMSFHWLGLDKWFEHAPSSAPFHTQKRAAGVSDSDSDTDSDPDAYNDEEKLIYKSAS